MTIYYSVVIVVLTILLTVAIGWWAGVIMLIVGFVPPGLAWAIAKGRGGG